MSSSSNSIPEIMKGVLIEKTGGTEVLQYKEDLPVPVPKEGELLVKNEYIGINFIDTYFRTGLYPSTKPEILGIEASGHIIACGPSPIPSLGFALGDRVVWNWRGSGTYAEYSTIPAIKAFKIPGSITSATACAAFLQGLTALTLVEEAHKVLPDDWVLVLAASGGVGGWLCQILRAKGAKMIAVVGRRGKLSVAKESGAEIVLVEGEDDVLGIVREKTGGEGVRVVFDGVGKDTFERSLECVARKGSLISYGNASGAVPPFAISRLAVKNIKVVRPALHNYVHTRSELENYSSELFRLIEEKKFSVRIHEVYPLRDVAKAHNDIEGRKTMGKLLMTP